MSDKIFGNLAYNSMRTSLIRQRRHLAETLNNPELLKLTFVSVRHFYGTKLYHQTKDLLYVQKRMGHKRFTSTLQYINYEKAIYDDYGEDEWVCKVVASPEDAKELIEVGFEFVDEINGKHLYRKQKVRVK